eukprot:11974128-Karenia_brevis.AAC.1
MRAQLTRASSQNCWTMTQVIGDTVPKPTCSEWPHCLKGPTGPVEIAWRKHMLCQQGWVGGM